MHATLRRLIVAALLIGCCSSTTRAQDFRGAIAGTITDATGGVVPGVTVTVDRNSPRDIQLGARFTF